MSIERHTGVVAKGRSIIVQTDESGEFFTIRLGTNGLVLATILGVEGYYASQAAHGERKIVRTIIIAVVIVGVVRSFVILLVVVLVSSVVFLGGSLMFGLGLSRWGGLGMVLE